MSDQEDEKKIVNEESSQSNDENQPKIDSNDPISTYSILSHCNAILVYGTKLGIEFAARGVPHLPQ